MRKPFQTFKHYRIGKGRVTLSVQVNEGNVSVGFSCCLPKDQFCRADGRDRAEERRLSADPQFSFTFQRNDQLLWQQLCDEFIRFATSNAKCPPWVVHSLRRGHSNLDYGLRLSHQHA